MKPHFPGSTGSTLPNSGDTQTLTARKVLTVPAGAAGAMAKVMVGPEAGPCRQPQITVQKEGDEITSIDVVCSCGERISIDLMH